MFRAMRGQGQQGLDQWIEDASPFLEAFKREGLSWLGMPAFGFAREQQERWQALAAAQLDYQDRSSAYNALMVKAAQRAYEVFEDKLAARAQPGAQLKSARALFDLWIDAAEEAYAEIALSPEFREVYGKLVDAQMRVRAGVQKEVEQAAAQFGMPTRTEVDAAHRKIAELERQVRRLRDAVATASAGAPVSRASAAGSASKPAASKPANGSNKLAGDPITGPRRGAAAVAKKATKQQTPTKPGATGAVGSKPGKNKAGKGKRA
jgi:class III poly(R)-hydroxyalkanoic acid synthase PhaE subunit